MRHQAFSWLFGTALLCAAACVPYARPAHADIPADERDSAEVSPLQIRGKANAVPVGTEPLAAPAKPISTAAQDDPSLARSEYVLPPVEVRAFRTLSASDLPILAWTDTDTKGVYRHEADATSLRFALNLGWLNPFNW